MNVYDAAIEVLAPVVGRPAAEICLHSAAMSLGKESHGLEQSDLPTLVARIHRDMSPFAAPSLLDAACAEITARASAA